MDIVSAWNNAPDWLRLIGAFAGVVLAGAAGNAAWEWAIKPLLPWSARRVIQLATFGIKRARDSVYRRAAHDAMGSSLRMLYFFCAAGIVSIYFGFGLFFGSSAHWWDLGSMNTKVSAPTLDAWLAGISFFATVFLASQFAQKLAGWSIASAFARRVILLRPVITSAELARLEAQFAAMDSESDYDAIRILIDDHYERWKENPCAPLFPTETAEDSPASDNRAN